MAKTSIAWTDRVWNPVRGCSKVSEGCRHCYAERFASRFSGTGMPYYGLIRDGHWANVARFVPDMLVTPLHWKQPYRVFVNSMSDLFHESVSDEQIAAVFSVMAACQQHTFQVLTKRPQRMAEWFRRFLDICKTEAPYASSFELPLPNVHLGVSVEDQTAAEERITLLLECPAAVHWVSCEPLLGPVVLTAIKQTVAPGFFGDTLQWYHRGRAHVLDGIEYPSINWVVCGGESGPNARPMHPDWVRSLRDQCRDAGVPFHFKQWGEWRESPDGSQCVTRDGRNLPNLEPSGNNGDGAVRIARVGKAVAGNLLDGARYEMRPGDKWQ